MRLRETQVPQARLWCARSGPDMRNVGWGGMGWDGWWEVRSAWAVWENAIAVGGWD